MAAYGLYTHISSNKLRSMLLLAGLFLLIYVMVFAGALIAEVVINGDGSVNDYLIAASRDLIKAFPWATLGAALFAGMFGFTRKEFFDLGASRTEVETVPTVKF